MLSFLVVTVISLMINIISTILLLKWKDEKSQDSSIYEGLKFRGMHVAVDALQFIVVGIYMLIVLISLATREDPNYSINAWTLIDFTKYYYIPIMVLMSLSRLVALISMSNKRSH